MPNQEIVVFLWQGSPWAGKVQAYLALRGIPYTVCPQPITQPRPDLAALGIKYRRIPVLSMGRDFYCDTLLILEKLEEWFQGGDHKPIGASDATGKAMEKLLEKWTDVAVFIHAAAAIPSDLELFSDPDFQKDREELWGRPWTKQEQDRLRPSGLANLRTHMDFLETLLGDGRQWALGEQGPGLADIHACWIFDWMFSLPGAMPESFFNKEHYPKTIAWRDRYNAAIAKAKKESPEPQEITGDHAISRILAADFFDKTIKAEDDPSGFREGDEVEIFPTDTGFTRRDTGVLAGLTKQEVVLKAQSQQGGKEIRIHFPRWNFSIEKPAAVNGNA